MPKTRLNKFLAHHGGYSRRQADELISKKRVTINDNPAVIGARLSETDIVKVDGKELIQTELITLLLHKPVGYVCSRKKQGHADTIYSLLPENYHSLKTVGRLDKDSSGLILLTNDGDLAQQMTHPKYVKRKVYEVTLDTPLQPLHRQMISDFGVILDDGKSQFELERLHDNDDTAWRITMHEGRNRQIRRTFNTLGYVVKKLHRVAFGAYSVDELKIGEHKSLT